VLITMTTTTPDLASPFTEPDRNRADLVFTFALIDGEHVPSANGQSPAVTNPATWRSRIFGWLGPPQRSKGPRRTGGLNFSNAGLAILPSRR
jgi:hypothetical protein